MVAVAAGSVGWFPRTRYGGLVRHLRGFCLLPAEVSLVRKVHGTARLAAQRSAGSGRRVVLEVKACSRSAERRRARAQAALGLRTRYPQSLVQQQAKALTWMVKRLASDACVA